MRALLLALPLVLSACGAAVVAPVSAPPEPHRYVPPPQARRGNLPPVHVQSLPGLEGVIGATAPELARQFGAARLDVVEGDARKLQFTGSACVLDIYLYPLEPGRAPQATYVDARRGDGRDVDRAACVAALKKR